MTEPLDLDSIATAEPMPFVFGGQTFTLSGSPDVAMWELLNKGEFRAALYMALGEEQYEAMDTIPPDVAVMDHAKLVALIAAYEKHLGIEAPKSSGPNRQSRRTQVR